MEERLELPQGTLDLLILKALTLESMHGWAISERLQQISREALQIQQGSLYPALHRLERRGWIGAKWATSENNRRAKYYKLTPRGQKELETESAVWRKLAVAVGLVLDLTAGESNAHSPPIPTPSSVSRATNGFRGGRRVTRPS